MLKECKAVIQDFLDNDVEEVEYQVILTRMMLVFAKSNEFDAMSVKEREKFVERFNEVSELLREVYKATDEP